MVVRTRTEYRNRMANDPNFDNFVERCYQFVADITAIVVAMEKKGIHIGDDIKIRIMDTRKCVGEVKKWVEWSHVPDCAASSSKMKCCSDMVAQHLKDSIPNLTSNRLGNAAIKFCGSFVVDVGLGLLPKLLKYVGNEFGLNAAKVLCILIENICNLSEDVCALQSLLQNKQQYTREIAV